MMSGKGASSLALVSFGGHPDRTVFPARIFMCTGVPQMVLGWSIEEPPETDADDLEMPPAA